jgi:DNA/RNA endonuclease YhcR with UshA esterase domain
MRKLLTILPAIFLLSMTVQLKAQNAPAAAPASQPNAILATDKEAIDAAMDQEATVEGTVSDAKWSTSGKVFVIKFEGTDTTQFQAVLFSKSREAMEKAFGGDLGTAFTGAKIQVHGKLQTFKEHPEITVNNPDQIVVVSKPSATTEPAAP